MYVRLVDPVEVPVGLADMPPGPALGAVLAGLDLTRVPNEHTVAVMQAQHRQVAHEQARLLASIVEVGRSTPFSDPEDPQLRALLGVQRLQAVQEWAAGEIAAALTLTGPAADRELDFAETVVTRLPQVHAALWAGKIDRPKAWVFAEHLEDLTGEQVTTICQALVPVASRLTTGQLRARLVRMIHDIDPEHARRRYRRAVRARAVVGYLSPEGTVTVTANGLPADEAAVACERLDVLAGAVQRAGHPGRLGQIQTDLFLGMLDGRFHHLTEQQIIAAMLARVRPEDTEPAGGLATTDDAAHPTPAEPSSPAAPATAADVGGVPADDVVVGRGAELRTGVEIRVGLSTLIGLDDRCGEIPGLGPVPPDTARSLVADQHHGAQWRYAVTDTDGHLIVAGVIRCRPSVPAAERGACRGGVVEIHLCAETLARLTADPHACGPWAPVVADIAGQHADRDSSLARLDCRPTSRFARAALARHIEVRDRTCCFPGCRRPARGCDKDHTRDHTRGGPTTRSNIGPLCDRHHRYKTEGWWALTQPEPGRFRWTSPLGQTYRTRGEPINPPTVSARPRPAASDPDTGSGQPISGPILRRPPPRPTPPRTPSEDPDDAPPF